MSVAARKWQEYEARVLSARGDGDGDGEGEGPRVTRERNFRVEYAKSGRATVPLPLPLCPFSFVRSSERRCRCAFH